MTARVYVAASSDELDRAEAAMAAVRAEGWEVTCDWVATIRRVGVANPRDVPRDARGFWASEAMVGVDEADAVWLLAPEAGHARGAFVEFGYAFARDKPIVVSGPTHACSIFTALVDEVPTDAEGLAKLRELI